MADEKTAGQVAYEAYSAVAFLTPECHPWEDEPPTEQRAWEAAADAAAAKTRAGIVKWLRRPQEPNDNYQTIATERLLADAIERKEDERDG